MSLMSLLIANRGEIAIRIVRAAAELGMRTVAIFSEDDAHSLHTRKADEARPLQGRGAAAYLDIEQIVAVAKQAGCDAIHPGYGFLSENAEFARQCAEAGVIFVGPQVETLALFGDKGQARILAKKCRVPVLPGTSGSTSLGGGLDLCRWESVVPSFLRRESLRRSPHPGRRIGDEQRDRWRPRPGRCRIEKR